MRGKPIAGALVAGAAIVVVALAVFTQVHPRGTEAAGAPVSSGPTSHGSPTADSALPGSTSPGSVSPGAVPPVSSATPPPQTPATAKTLARFRELTARAEQLVAAITPPNGRRNDLPMGTPSGGPLPNGGLPDTLTNGIESDRPATASGPPTQTYLAPRMPDFVNGGYPTLARLVPDLAPSAALRCHYPRRPDGSLAATASATTTYTAATAWSLTTRLSAAPVGQLHAAVDNATAQTASADLLILTYPGRAPVVVTFTSYGISNGDIIIAVRHVNPVDGSPLWLPGTASLAGILDQAA